MARPKAEAIFREENTEQNPRQDREIIFKIRHVDQTMDGHLEEGEYSNNPVIASDRKE